MKALNNNDLPGAIKVCVILPEAPDIDTVSAVSVPSGAVATFGVTVTFVFTHAALSNCSLYVSKFSTLLAPSNLASPLFACRIIPSKSVTEAAVARVKVGFPVPAWRSRVLLRSAAKAGASLTRVAAARERKWK